MSIVRCNGECCSSFTGFIGCSCFACFVCVPFPHLHLVHVLTCKCASDNPQASAAIVGVAKSKDILIDWFLPPKKEFVTDADDLFAMLDCPRVHEKLPGLRELCDAAFVVAKDIKRDAHCQWKISTELALPISLYTGSVFYMELNAEMRHACAVGAAERRVIKQSWGKYIRALFTSLSHIPDYNGLVFRAVPVSLDLVKDNYRPKQKVRFNAFTSTSVSKETALQYLQDVSAANLTMFRMHVSFGKSIQAYSEFPHEGEVLMKPNSEFMVVANDALLEVVYAIFLL